MEVFKDDFQSLGYSKTIALFVSAFGSNQGYTVYRFLVCCEVQKARCEASGL